MYKILKAEVSGEILNTEVEYDGIGKITVSHLRPADKEYVLANIVARGESELAKKVFTARNQEIKVELDKVAEPIALEL
jgi:hypothetical protein